MLRSSSRVSRFPAKPVGRASANIRGQESEDVMSRETPEQVLKSIVDGINTGNLDALMSLYEPEAAFAPQPGSLAHGSAGVRESLAAFIAMKGTLDLRVTRVLEAGGLALVAGAWSFTGTGPDGKPVTLTGHNGDVLRRQDDGSWRFVIDNPWGTE
jgi:ketosteroid isomerase-like protein